MRAQITVLGVVQGVGFRPFVAECARTLSLRGSVCNSGGVVSIEAYGTKEAMEELSIAFVRVRRQPPGWTG